MDPRTIAMLLLGRRHRGLSYLQLVHLAGCLEYLPVYRSTHPQINILNCTYTLYHSLNYTYTLHHFLMHTFRYCWSHTTLGSLAQVRRRINLSLLKIKHISSSLIHTFCNCWSHTTLGSMAQDKLIITWIQAHQQLLCYVWSYRKVWLSGTIYIGIHILFNSNPYTQLRTPGTNAAPFTSTTLLQSLVAYNTRLTGAGQIDQNGSTLAALTVFCYCHFGQHFL